MFWQILLLILITFLLRSIPGIFHFRTESSDEIYHLLCAKRIKENKFRYPEKLKDFLLPGIYDYPPLFHYLLAIFPKAKREKIAPYVSAILDSISVVLLYFFVLYITGVIKQNNDLNAYSLAFSAGLIFTTSPALLYYGVGPRAFHATPRTLGELFLTTTFFLASIWYFQGFLWAFFVSGLFSGLALLASKFSGQVLIFFFVILAIFLKAPFLLILPIVGFAFAYLFSKGHYHKVLVGWIKHSIFYKNVLSKKFSLLVNRNNFSDIKNIFVNITQKNLKNCVQNIINLISNNTYFILIIRNVMFFILLYFSFTYSQFFLSNMVFIFLISWIGASLIVFFFTSLKPFMFLGEAERYIEYSVPAQAILLSFYLAFAGLHNIINFLLIYHGIFYIFNFILIYNIYKTSLPNKNALLEVCFWLNSNGIINKRLLVIPGDYYRIIMYKTENAVLYPPANYTMISKNDFEEIWEELGWYNRDLDNLVKKYDINLIIVQHQSLKTYAFKKGWCYNFKEYNKIFRNDFYLVFKT